MEDINKLIQQNTGLIFKQLIKFNLVDDPDAESLGYWALYNAINNFDESKGNKLSTVATVYIYNALGSYVRAQRGKRQLEVISYNNVAFTDDSEEHEFVDFFSSSESVENEYLKKELLLATMNAFNQSYDKLANAKHKEILGIWRASDFKASTTDISKMTSVSQSYVSQVINNFKHCLRKKLEDIYYD